MKEVALKIAAFVAWPFVALFVWWQLLFGLIPVRIEGRSVYFGDKK